MPNTKSAEKALRQSERRRTRNVARKDAMKKTVKTYRKLVEGNKSDEAKGMLPAVYKTLDKMAKAGTIKKNKADRMKSRLTKKLTKSKPE